MAEFQRQNLNSQLLNTISAQLLPTESQNQHEWFKHDLEVLWVKLEQKRFKRFNLLQVH